MIIAPTRDNASPTNMTTTASPRRQDVESRDRTLATAIIERARVGGEVTQTSRALYQPDAGRAAMQIASRSAPPTRSFIELSTARTEFTAGAAAVATVAPRRLRRSVSPEIVEYRRMGTCRRGFRKGWCLLFYVVIGSGFAGLLALGLRKSKS